jgi:ketosteroid isomerase-like protein
MTNNKQTVETYMEGFRRTDHAMILRCLTDDVEWELPGAFHIHGKSEFDRHIEDDAFVGKPEITVSRLTEENDVVIAEGSVRTQLKDGRRLELVFCDVFEMREGKIRRLVSYLVQTASA